LGLVKDRVWPGEGLGISICFGLSILRNSREEFPDRSLPALGSEIDCLRAPSCLFKVDGLRRSSLKTCLSDLRSDLDVMEVPSFFLDGTLESRIPE
jgi:hypothetical protein